MANQNNTPKRKHLRRTERLQALPGWLKSYQGKNLIAGYANWFGVDIIVAIKELRMGGVEIFPEKEKAIKDGIASTMKQRLNRKLNAEVELEDKEDVDGDEFHDFIVGFTPEGVAYGIPKKDKVEIKRWEKLKEKVNKMNKSADDPKDALPF